MPLEAPVTIATLLDTLLISPLFLIRLPVPPDVHRCELRLEHMKISIYAPYAKERFETARQDSILHPERIVDNPEVIPRNVGEERALPLQSNSVKTFILARAAPVPGSGKRLKICQFGGLRGSRKLLIEKIFWLRGSDLN